jgi:hypothetical protein
MSRQWLTGIQAPLRQWLIARQSRKRLFANPVRAAILPASRQFLPGYQGGAVVSNRDRARIGRMEANGELSDLRRKVRDWYGRHPTGSYLDAMRDLGVPEYLVGVVDAELVDARVAAHAKTGQAEPDIQDRLLCRAQVTEQENRVPPA